MGEHDLDSTEELLAVTEESTFEGVMPTLPKPAYTSAKQNFK